MMETDFKFNYRLFSYIDDGSTTLYANPVITAGFENITF